MNPGTRLSDVVDLYITLQEKAIPTEAAAIMAVGFRLIESIDVGFDNVHAYVDALGMGLRDIRDEIGSIRDAVSERRTDES